jgi:hypothetical protein
VVLMDVHMPFRAMFWVALRWAIASTPALIVTMSLTLIGLNFLMQLGLVPTPLQLGITASPLEPGLRGLYHHLRGN